ncbi:MAG: hypothetical protein BWY75_02416 [bacterium ADurb.Bin425]|nr:MAG: hypothetical protein BWY75_02416 [bacterium ADurb.Bin425]
MSPDLLSTRVYGSVVKADALLGLGSGDTTQSARLSLELISLGVISFDRLAVLVCILGSRFLSGRTAQICALRLPFFFAGGLF